MDESLKIFNLIDSNYQGEKCFVFEIGTRNCSFLNQFFINGYTNLTAIDKAGIYLHACFFNFKILKGEISKHADQIYILHDRDDAKLNINNTREANSYYEIELEKYYNSIQLIGNSNGDFFNFQASGKFNIIISSFVFHFYPPEDDINIINKLIELSRENCLIYIKVYNIEKIKTIDPQTKVEGNTIIKDNDIRYLFDKNRISSYKNKFEVIFEKNTGDKSELLLKWKSNSACESN